MIVAVFLQKEEDQLLHRVAGICRPAGCRGGHALCCHRAHHGPLALRRDLLPGSNVPGCAADHGLHPAPVLHRLGQVCITASEVKAAVIPRMNPGPCVCRYYAICCQPLVYRHKMTPVRVAAMLSGCWLIPTFISFLPIMQSWNTIGIEDIVSPLPCPSCVFWKVLIFFVPNNRQRGHNSRPACDHLLLFWKGFADFRAAVKNIYVYFKKRLQNSEGDPFSLSDIFSGWQQNGKLQEHVNFRFSLISLLKSYLDFGN